MTSDLSGHDPLDAALRVDDRPAAVARLDGDGELDHLAALDLALADTTPLTTL